MTSESIICSNPSFSFKLEGKVAGAITQILASGVECPEGRLANTPVGGVNMATATGKVKFTGVTVLSPLGCETPSTNTTVALKESLQMDFFESERGFVKFEPASGTTLTNLSLDGCAAEGKYPLKGIVFFQAKNKQTRLW